MAVISEAGLSSLVLGSTDPKRLGAWYQSAFAPDVEIEDSVLRLTQGFLVFEERDDVATQATEPGRIIINIQVREMATLVAHLNTLKDLEWVRPVEDIPVGQIATIKDADGNFVNILQLNE
ncbi:VOC family protein [Nocardia terpenica]|uniref:VOC family protein n=1 Tax=Nocardia terpenica TaxID=455432 RepID=UPI001893CA4B|nr:VOC family protein [Nocardia terpenica]MBF6065451.1 VOC family protein [Nocardia terpenica]MBF6109133.1 VOC family protein [Nocardia terpenica]MBF6114665.1 VOC family protein [Nocardia terpenica]MBF6123350.1 VOC family protein [Nocardia terpenica]MBF6156632.1 VOC family protein [Nocardia terpenica]